VRPGADELTSAPLATGRIERIRAAVGVAVIVLVVAAAGYAIYRERHAFVDTLREMGAGALVLSLLFGMAGVAATFPMWREVLHGLGVDLPWGTAARVFFASQLGKYLPGSVWPVVMQMEAGRARGASRRTMLGANLITTVMNCCVGLAVACLLLPLFDAHALTKYWWALLALPPLLALLHPRALPAVLDRLFALLGRAPLGERLPVRSGLRASAWSLVSWVLLGAHLAVLCAALGRTGATVLVLCVGGMALAVVLGVLFIPAPAGAGIRDIVLKLVLAVILTTSGQALAVVVASRVLFILADLILAAVATVLPNRQAASD
jgi:uncharacterized membrane protein YbhN (UPF0104 family)